MAAVSCHVPCCAAADHGVSDMPRRICTPSCLLGPRLLTLSLGYELCKRSCPGAADAVPCSLRVAMLLLPKSGATQMSADSGRSPVCVLVTSRWLQKQAQSLKWLLR